MALDLLEPTPDQLNSTSQQAWERLRNLKEHPGLEKCLELGERVATAVNFANQWMQVARNLADQVETGSILNMTQTGDTIVPIVESVREWFDETALELQDGQAQLCEPEILSGFADAKSQFDAVYAYLSQWPRSCSEHIARVRQEIAKGLAQPVR